MNKRNKYIIVLTVLTLFAAGAFYYKAKHPSIEDKITPIEYATHELTLENVLTRNDSSTFFKVAVANKTEKLIRYSVTGFAVSNTVESHRSYSAYLADEKKFVNQEGQIPAGGSKVIDFLVNLSQMSIKDDWEISLEILSD